jgi:hypothetical protein
VELRPLHVVLAKLLQWYPRLVLSKGRNYWRIEELVRQARGDIEKGPEESRHALTAPIYRFDEDTLGKVVVWKETGLVRTPVFSEVGSDVKVDD